MDPSLHHLRFDWTTHPNNVQTSPMTHEGRKAFFAARILFAEEGIHAKKSQVDGRWYFVRDTPPKPISPKTPEVPDITPLLNEQGLLSCQKEPVQRIVASLKKYGAHLNASDMGTGKTYMTLAAYRELGITPVVVAPATLLVEWQRVASYLGMECRPVSYEKLNRKTPFGAWRGTDKFLRFQWAADVEGIVFDESHRCKGTGTKAQKVMVAAKRSGKPTAALTATGAATPLEMKALGCLLGLHDGRDFWDWAEIYGCTPGYHGGYEFSNWPGIMERIHRQIFPAKGWRLRVEELGEDIPSNQFVFTPAQLPERSKKAIDGLYRDMYEAVDALHERVEDWKAPGSPLMRILALFQEIELLKAPAFVQHIRDSVEEGCSVILFARYNATLKLVAKGLKEIHHGWFTGASSPTERDLRQRDLDAFQDNVVRVLLTNYAAGATGLTLSDLHGGHMRVSLHSLHHNARLVKQAFGRTPRIGAQSHSVQKIIGAAGTIEDEILDRISQKSHNMDLLNDGDLLPESFGAKLVKLMQSRETPEMAQPV